MTVQPSTNGPSIAFGVVVRGNQRPPGPVSTADRSPWVYPWGESDDRLLAGRAARGSCPLEQPRVRGDRGPDARPRDRGEHGAVLHREWRAAETAALFE